MDRRRTLKTIFCSSAALALGSRLGWSADSPGPLADGAMHLLAIGDFGTTGKEQLEVAAAMQRYISERGIEPQHLLLLGDNFYSNDKAGFSVESELWKKTFEDVYPSAAFPGPCHAVLGNHDYHNNPGGEKVQLAYSAKQRSRFTIPAK